MYLTLMSDVSYKSQYLHHTIQIFGKTVTVIHEQNSKQRAECLLTDEFIVTLDNEGTTVYFESEDDFVKVVTMLNQFSREMTERRSSNMIIPETHETEIKFSIYEKNGEFFIEPVSSNNEYGEHDITYDYWIDTCDTLDEALKRKAGLEWKHPQ